MIMYDFDKILVAVPNLNSFLFTQPSSVKGIHDKHYLPKDDHFHPFLMS